jgi:hypothetical protein
MVLVTQSRKLGAIGGNTVYGIKATEMIPISNLQEGDGDERAEAGGDDEGFGAMMGGLFDKLQRRLNPTAKEIAEQKYYSIFQFIELTKDFYYSMSYDLTHTLQHNMTAASPDGTGAGGTGASGGPPASPSPGPEGDKVQDTPEGDGMDDRQGDTCRQGDTHDPFGRRTACAWNHYLTAELESIVGPDDWVVPMLNGHFVQRRCSIFGCHLDIILLGRRSRFYAGTRYLKRGISDQGKVANDVESEQILHVEGIGGRDGCYGSYVQMRGSIPVYWSQETSVTQPKPPITLKRKDPTFAASRLHVQDMFTRYGSPLLFLNLVKQKEKREREVLVGREFALAVRYLNNSLGALPPRGAPQHSLRYVALDFSRISKEKHMDVMKALDDIATWCLNSTGFFCTLPPSSSSSSSSSLASKAARSDDGDQDFSVDSEEEKDNDDDDDDDDVDGDEDGSEGTAEAEDAFTGPRSYGQGHALGQEYVEHEYMEQRGVIRSNCIDCLDRTNVAQFSVAMCALGRQLFQMGLRNTPVLDIRSRIVVLMMEMWSQLGDRLAIQYGGSEAHKKVDKGGGASKTARNLNKHKELLTSIRRYYSNSFTDRLKQDAINLFLGNFRPHEIDHEDSESRHLWDLENDQYLHNFNVTSGPVKLKEQLQWERREEEKEAEEQHEREREAIESGRGDDDRVLTPATKAARRRLRCAAYLERDKWWKAPIQAHHAHEFNRDAARIAANAGDSAFEAATTAAAYAAQAEGGVGTTSGSLSKHGRYPTIGEPLEDRGSTDGKLQLPSPFELKYAPQQLTEFDDILASEFLQPISIEDKPQNAGAGLNTSGGLSGTVSTAASIPAALGAGFNSASGALSDVGEGNEEGERAPRLSIGAEPQIPPTLHVASSSIDTHATSPPHSNSRLGSVGPTAFNSFSDMDRSGATGNLRDANGNYETFDINVSGSRADRRLYEGSRLSRHPSSASTMSHYPSADGPDTHSTMTSEAASSNAGKQWSIKKFVGGAKSVLSATMKSAVPSTIQDGIAEEVDDGGDNGSMDAVRRGLTAGLGMQGSYGGAGAYDSASMVTLDHFSHYVSFEHDPER